MSCDGMPPLLGGVSSGESRRGAKVAVLLAITSKRRSRGHALWLSPLCSLTPNWSGHCPRRGLHLGRAVLIPSELKLRGRAAWALASCAVA